MKIYCDTSFFIALKFQGDVHHETATGFFEAEQENSLLWSPWNRVEVVNAFRQMARGKGPLLSVPESRRLIYLLEKEVRLGYFMHREVDWRDVFSSAYGISSEHAFEMQCRSADLLHVAYAKELGAELFVSFDEDQVELAGAVGMKATVPGG